MAITAETRQDIIELVVTAYNAAPGTSLLTELVAIVDNGGTLADVADNLTARSEWTSAYPAFQTAEEFASEWLGNLVPEASAEALAEGVSVAVGLINGGASFGDLLIEASSFLSALDESDASFGTSAANFSNKVEVATYHTITQETDGIDSAALASVTSDDASVDTGKAAVDAVAPATGQTYSLTTGLDVNVIGGAFDDTFSALDGNPALATGDPSTVQSGDAIDGGAGTDTLVWTATPSAAGTAVVTTSNVEGLKVYNNTNNDAYSIDASMMTGVTDIYAMGGNATTTVTGTGLVNVHMISTSENVTVTKAATAGLGSSDAVTILGNNAASTSAATVDYDGAETVNLVAAGAIGTATRSLTITNDDLETLNITGAGAVNVTTTFTGAAASSQTATLDASEAGGVVRATVTRGASSNSAITLSANNDHLTMVSAISKDDVLVGGDGTDILETGDTLSYSATATAQEGAGISGFETLRLQTGGSVDMRALTGDNDITSVVYEATGSVTKSAGITSVTQLANGTATLGLATDSAADEVTATIGSGVAAGGVVATLAAADMETINVVSAGLTTDNTLTLSGATADVTTVNASGRGLNLTVSGTSVATVDASDVAGLGSAFTLTATASTADMTVTGSSVVPTDTDNDTADNISTGSGDDTITTGGYNDIIDAGAGANTVDAGDGDNSVTTGRGNDTITVGDGDNTIVAGIGDDTVTAGGTATSANSINLGNGDDTLVSGAGVDTVTLGSGDDNVSTGGGADKIYMSDFDDDDVVDGGAGTDTLSASALATAAALAGAQVQAVGVHVDMTPGTSRTSTPQFTGVENAYIDVNLAAANLETSATTNETVDFDSSSGLSNLYLNVTDADNTNAAKLTLNKVDASAIHLIDSGTTDDLGELVVVGDGQASLTLKGHDFDGGTDLTVSDVDAVTITAYVDNSLVAVGDTTYGDVEADDSDTVTVTAAAGTAALVDTLTVNSLSADAATAINLNAGAFNTLAITGALTSSSDALDTMAIVVSDDGTLTAADIETTGSEMTSATITLGIASTLTITNEIDLVSVDDVTITVGAASAITADDLAVGGDVVINATMGSNIGIDVFGKAGITGTFDINGRGNLGAQANQATKTIAMAGETTLNIAGYTDTTGGTITINAGTAGDKTIVGNNQATSITTAGGDDTITGGTGIDTITDSGAGDDTLTLGAGNDIVTDAGTGDDIINTGAGDDTVTDAGAGADVITLGEGADSVDAGAGADSIILTETTAALDNVIYGAASDSATFALNAGATNSISTTGMDIITGMDATDTFELAMYTGIAAAIGADTLLDTDEATQLTTVVAGGTLPGANSIGTVRGTYDADAETFVGSATGDDLILIYDANPLVATTALESVVVVGGGALTITVAAGATGTLDIA